MKAEISKFYELSKAKICDETTQLFTNLAPKIQAWLSSDEFLKNYSHLAYVPLLNPKSIDYLTSDPKFCFILNIPLPKVFDFFIFGSHGVGLESALPGFLKLCGCKCVARDGEKDSQMMYISYFRRLIKAHIAKQNGKYVSIALLIADFIQDELNEKFYALVPRAKTLYIVRDPITNLKTLCNLEQQKCYIKVKNDELSEISNDLGDALEIIKRKGRKKIAYRFSDDPYKLSQNLVSYAKNVNGEFLPANNTPSPEAVNLWIFDLYQGFHDGVLFRALVNIKNEDILIKKTDDFIGKNAMPTMSELARHFGFLQPKKSDEWLFNLRVSDYKALLPAVVIANINDALYNENLPGGGGASILSKI